MPGPGQQQTIDSIFERLSKKKGAIAHPVDLFTLRVNGTRDWYKTRAIADSHVLDLVSFSKHDDTHSTRMIATSCYSLFGDAYFADFFDFIRPHTKNVLNKTEQKKARIVLVWDFNSQDWRYINIDHWYVAGALPMFLNGSHHIENIIRLAFWYKYTYKPTTKFRHERFKTFK